ncbi:uncharacterized protein P884DRAFT_266151 [Thermothelomyces heterothallicus CBS 202.75]|uniref:uncharacterized protein n=1 Tax=Thermothelomyces heterothallicus CBS 202.75 TaxID=1149848 RepID=UPI0037426866
MDGLPLKVIAYIASYLPKRSGDGDGVNANRRLVRPAIATLPRKWQFAVEPLVFRTVRIKSTELDEFADADADRGHYESNQDRHRLVFDILSGWGSDLSIWLPPGGRKQLRDALIHRPRRSVLLLALRRNGAPPREPFWSSLANLKVELDLGSPSGRWYFRAEPGDRYNVPSSEPLPADTVGHMPPGYGYRKEDTQAALELDRRMRLAEKGGGPVGLLPHRAGRRAWWFPYWRPSPAPWRRCRR